MNIGFDWENLKIRGLITPDEESLWTGYFEEEEKAKMKRASLEDCKPVLSRRLAEARQEAKALRAEGPRLLMEFALSGDRKALAHQRASLRALDEIIVDCEAALSAVSQKIEHGFTGIFSRANLARTKIQGRTLKYEQDQAKKN
jgi:hypothetical protein